MARVLWLLAAVVGAALLSLALRPAAQIFDTPMTEDGYYALTVARNLAWGHGLTIDGQALTNGFQPLFTMVEALAFAIAGKDQVLAMRLVLGFAWLIHLGGALLAGLVARDAWPTRAAGEAETRQALAALLYLASPLLFGHAYNGLETATALLFYLACWRWVQSGRDESLAGVALFGVLLGLTVLARIDAGFLAVALAGRELWRLRRRGLGMTAARLALLAGMAFLVSSPWWLYNLLYFGSPLPTSGLAQQGWALDAPRLESAEWALRLMAAPWIFLGAEESWLSGGARGVILLGLAALAWRGWRRGWFGRELAAAGGAEAARLRRGGEFALCLAAAMLLLVGYYTFGFTAYWFYYRYFAPVALFAFVIAPIALARLVAPAADARRRVAALAAIALLTAQGLALPILARLGIGLGGNTVYHDQVALAREHVPPGALVAGGQTGTLGFFRAGVVNLDGKVNRDALAHQDRMWEYLRARDVRWFVDWPYYVEKYLGQPPEKNGWKLVAERNYFYVYQYVGPSAP